MNEETVKQENATIDEAPQTEKTFTQTEVDQIVSERLKRDRAKRADDIAAAAAEIEEAKANAAALESELNAMKEREAVRQMRDKVAAETGVPGNLLTGETEEECTAQAAKIMEFAVGKNAGMYPRVPDSGEVTHTTPQTTRQQFADWFNSEMKNN